MTPVHIVIPARFKSSRLPGKPLISIAGKPMILHVIDRAIETGYCDILVATDDQAILSVVSDAGAIAVMTRTDHESGTDRLAEVVNSIGWDENDIVVNLQGDEPLMRPGLIRQLAELLDSDETAHMATIVTPIYQIDDLLNPNIVKVVVGEENQALYFSRAPIPYPRDAFNVDRSIMPDGKYLRHLGIYAYRVKALKAISALPVTSLEQLEKLEQLRPLTNGMRILVECVDEAPVHGVDTLEDLAHVETLFSQTL